MNQSRCNLDKKAFGLRNRKNAFYLQRLDLLATNKKHSMRPTRNSSGSSQNANLNGTVTIIIDDIVPRHDNEEMEDSDKEAASSIFQPPCGKCDISI